MLNIGEIVFIEDIKKTVLLINDTNEKLVGLILEKETSNKLIIENTDLVEGKLDSNYTTNYETLFFNKDISIKKLAQLNEFKMDFVLRSLVKQTAGYFYKNKNNKKNDYIPVSGKVINEKELENMLDASMDMWLTTGRFNKEFEEKLANFIGVEYALTTNSGSSANLLAVTALTSPKLGERQLKEGDEVITVAAGFPTTITPIIQNKLIPVFVDIEIGTYDICVDQLEEALSKKTKAIIIAHTLGNPFNIERIKQFAEKYNLWLIEDNCDALGSKFNGKYTGQFGDIATLSFYPAHHITMGEGGALLTSNGELHQILMSFRDWGRDCWCSTGTDNTCSKRFSQKHGNLPFGYDHKYVYSHLGYNLKIVDSQAAIGLAQIEKLPFFIQQRIKNFNHLYSGLKELSEYLILPKATKNSEPSWFGFPISVKPSPNFNKINLVKYLEKSNIGTRQLFAGNMLRQPAFIDADISFRVRSSKILKSSEINETIYELLPGTDRVLHETFWIGVWPGLSAQEIDYVIHKFHDFFSKKLAK